MNPEMDLVCEIRRETVGRFLLVHPKATETEIKEFIRQEAVDRRQGQPGTGLLIHDESPEERSLNDWLVIVREEIRNGIIRG
jgi:hypothetical protein